MRPLPDSKMRTAFTLVELLVVLAVIVVLVLLIAPLLRHGHPPKYHLRCMSNQKQLALGLLIFAGDNSDMFPAQVVLAKGGALEPMNAGDVIPCYVALTNYVPNPWAFHCPTDKKRSVAARGQSIQRTNVSYFISLDASPTNSPMYSMLTGDRHLSANNQPVNPGLFALSTNQTLAWTTELHVEKRQPMGGSFTFADGHCEWVKPGSLSEIVARQNLPANRLAFP
jgi:prepilin-type N-terminal cleavage/methylation domain-containing protein